MTTDTLKQKAAEMSGLHAQTRAVESRILGAAEHRLAVVDADLDKLRARVASEPAAAERYTRLTRERARLQLVIAKARQRQ